MKKFYTMSTTKTIAVSMLILFQISFYSYGQIAKNSTYIGGQFLFYTQSQKYDGSQPDYKNNSGSINISVGKAISENTILGLYGGYSHSMQENLFDGSEYYNSNTDGFNVGVFYRKYKMIVKDFYFFGESGLGYSYSNQTSTAPSQEGKSYRQQGGNLYFSPGLSYKVCKILYLDVSLPYLLNATYTTSSNSMYPPAQKASQFSIGSSLSSGAFLSNLGVGFHFIF